MTDNKVYKDKVYKQLVEELSDLIEVDGIAEMFGVPYRYARDKLVRRPDFPKPTLLLSRKIRRWKRSEVVKYMGTLC